MLSAPEKLLLAAPRAYCAGVDRAVQTVERALDLYGAPVYVRKEIVHNKHAAEGHTIVLIGHAGHEEVEGTMGEAPDHIVLVETEEDVDRLEVPDPDRIA